MTVPGWVKSVCKDYGNNGIDEQTFLNCIQFLVDHGIIVLPIIVCPTSQPVQPESAQPPTPSKTTTVGLTERVNVESH